MNFRHIDPQQLYRLSLAEVKPLLYANAMTVFSGVTIEESADETACTDGRTVYLPGFKNYFPDRKGDLANNRNATMYLSDLIHEVGYHICAGAFLVDSKPTLNRFPNLKLAHAIFNILEDYRGWQHFRKHCPIAHWLELLDEEEQLFVSRFRFFDHWKSDFFSLLIAKGVYGFTPGDILPERSRKEKKLLKKKCTLYGMPTVSAKVNSLQTILDSLVKIIKRVKDKTVADSLLLIDEMYLTLIQVLGDDFMKDKTFEEACRNSKKNAGKKGNGTSSTPGTADQPEKPSENSSEGDRSHAPNFENISDLGCFPGEDVFMSSKKAREKGRKKQLKEFSSFIVPFQKEMNVPQTIENQNSISTVSNGPGCGRSSDQKPLLNVTTKIYEGEYDCLVRKRNNAPHKITLEKEERYHGQFREYYAEYQTVFKKMEEEVQRLLHQKETVSIEGRTPEELIIENLVDGIADPASVPFIDLYENEVQETKKLFGKLEVKILVDASGSTAGAILEKEKVFAAVLYKAFSDIEADVELFFFNTSLTTKIIQTMNLDAIGWVEAAGSNRDGAAIRHIAAEFNKNADRNLFIVISDGLPSAEGYSGAAALEDTLDAMFTAGQRDISMRYFNIGGMPDKIFDAFKKYTKNPRIFIDPEELIAFAPVFINDLSNEMYETE
jgi:hypothetical protein